MDAAQHRTPPRFASLFADSLIGMVSSLVVWAAYFVVAYVYLSIACASGPHRTGAFTSDAVQLTLVLLTVVALGLIALIARAGVRAGKGAQRDGRPKNERERRAFMSRATVLIAGLAFVATLWVGAGALVLAPCV